MKHNYTNNLLLKYLYNETSVLLKLEVENAINEDNQVRESYKELEKGYKMFPKVSFYPSDDTMSTILNYSQKQVLNTSF